MSSTSNRYAEIVRLSAPIAGIQFAQVALTTVDLLMMGLLNVGAGAAGGLGLLLYNQLRTMGVGMVTGVGNLVAGAVGRAEKRSGTAGIDDQGREEVRDLVRASMLIATLVHRRGATRLLQSGDRGRLADAGDASESLERGGGNAPGWRRAQVERPDGFETVEMPESSVGAV